MKHFFHEMQTKGKKSKLKVKLTNNNNNNYNANTNKNCPHLKQNIKISRETVKIITYL